jgi:DNA modification methylase
MIKDIHPRTPVASVRRDFTNAELKQTVSLDLVASLVGMSPQFVGNVLKNKGTILTLRDVLDLLDQDSFAETFIPRSRIPGWLLARGSQQTIAERSHPLPLPIDYSLVLGCAQLLIQRLPLSSVQCVVTSTPYWGTRLYEDSFLVSWADGEQCPFGNEQTPEGFVRHTVELLHLLKPVLTRTASVWWNLMDTYNTRTQIRRNASETLRAMRGEDGRGWSEHDCRRYSAGHSYLKDGEQCLIPAKVAERASRIGYYVKSLITWKKDGSMPETVGSRVTRELEYVIHLSVDRTPLFNKVAYLQIPESLGGRNRAYESEKLTDVWCLRTSAGRDGHGAQFPIELPGRCIALSTRENDLVVDPFVGAGTTVLAARRLDRRCIGFDISERYLRIAEKRATMRSSTLPREAVELPLLTGLP